METGEVVSRLKIYFLYQLSCNKPSFDAVVVIRWINNQSLRPSILLLRQISSGNLLVNPL